MKNLVFTSIVFVLLCCNLSYAQLLNYDNKVDLVLSDGTNLVLYGADAKPNEYYYLPVNLRLAQRPDGVPEFLFMKYTTEQRADAGGVQGAIMHFLMEWGLTAPQLADAQSKLDALFGKSTRRVYYGKNAKGIAVYKDLANAKDRPIIKGAVELQIEKDNSFKIVSAVMEDKTLTKSIVSSGKAPLIPGGKVAAAASFDKNGAQLMAATFEKSRSIADLSIALNYKYKLMAPAIDGSITIDWSKFYKFLEKKGHDYSYYYYHCGDCEVDGTEYDSYTSESEKYVGWDEITEELKKEKIVQVVINQQDIDNPIAKDVVDYFMQSFMESISDDKEERAVNEDAGKAGDSTPTKFASAHSFNMTKLKQRTESGHTSISLKFRAAVMREVQLVGNMASWYNAVKNNPQCVASINLNDPFFQHRDINMIVDLDSEDIFSKEVNYATVNIQKKRSSGNPFVEQVTIDRDYLKQKGVKATVTYARGEDRNSDVYEYKVQWSTRGGNVFPANPTWQKGDWQGITLAAPITQRNIQFEGNLDELKAAGFTRATLQVRYYKFGREVETNIPLTVSKNESLVEQAIFTDKDTRGYAYRIILNHKEKGKIAFDFDPKINDDYVYITIPKEIKDGNLDFWDKVRKAADAIIPPNTDGSIRPEHQILDKFLDVIKIFTPEKRG
ncbi:hypothetical protein [Haliscomenobacter hydrossis]|uniref:Uncharacterized protein n=1 Tax=Haliscomenobacter hydrossis (strain ATCC 27775 / DSM 1100 / LMG 10767 / O) TaxID=760192 RepID=F4L0R9_HALH1|nr:hypothetical protein [Haliscomenobacter hydrossis]AEE49551.1 hypothetical protein Halhy_1662 [Haliscomenobacter hydrossis DSM 1100]